MVFQNSPSTFKAINFGSLRRRTVTCSLEIPGRYVCAWDVGNTHRRWLTQLFQYAPRWGGFCSWGIARELPPAWPWAQSQLGPPASPWEGWFLGPDGSLAFNIWESYTDRFLRDGDANWHLAVERWEALHEAQPSAPRPFNTHCIGHGPLKNWCIAPQPAPWLEELPSCVVTTQSDNSTCQDLIRAGDQVVDSACLQDVLEVQGGGVVGNATQFQDFSNLKERWGVHEYILVALLVFMVAAAGVRGVQLYRKKRQAPTKAHESETDSGSAEKSADESLEKL